MPKGVPKRNDKDTEVIVNSGRKKGTLPKPRIGANGHKLPEKLPEGVTLTDVKKQQWILGQSIGLGGFGEIYLASDKIDQPVALDSKYVIKIEHHDNGPLFAEMHFYHRVGKEETIKEWVKDKKLDYLGMPRFLASGSHEYKGIKYRFMVMDRFGEDLQKILNRSNHVFNVKNVFVLGLRIIDILEYIHSFGYIHADVKASNLLLGYSKDGQNKVYLIDFGLACRFMVKDKHKEYKEDLRKAHDGTIEFTSRDAHIGAHSRRGDFEILGYNMLQWLCGRLPWEDNLKDPEYVSHQKSGYMMNVPLLMTKCFSNGNYPEAISTFLQYISNLKFEEEPDYNHCRTIFRSALKKGNTKDDMKLLFSPTRSVTATKRGKKASKSPAKKRTRKAFVPLSSTEESQDSETEVSETVPSQNKGRRKERMQLEATVSSDHSTKQSKSGSSRGRPPKKAASASYDEERISCNSLSSNENSRSKYDPSLENPTPAMLQVMERKLELQKLAAKQPKKTFASFSAAGNTDTLFKEQVVQKYKERSPELFPSITRTVSGKEVTKPKRLPRSQMAKGASKLHV